MSGLSLVVARGGLFFVVVHGFLIAVASLVVKHWLWGAQPSVVATCRL